MLLKIATANSRLAVTWTNMETTWEDFAEKLREPTRTKETFTEFKKMHRQEQARIKDTGGFVGGVLINGRRKAGTVRNRYLLCLDADYPTEDFIEKVRKVCDYEWVIYSTHSHSPVDGRYRLIIPTDRPVSPDEYIAISRKVAELIGIDMFDDSTYQPHRLMYYPSASCDGEYVYERNKTGKTISTDQILALYEDWQDASLWPVSTRVSKVYARDRGKQGNPLEKPGLIGQFCRTFPISAAIDKFLPEVYSGEGERYTYTKGTTSGGLVVYDDMFAFSHHGTDPCGDKLVNAWDMVRLHKYGHLDYELPETKKATSLPSFKAMVDLARKDDDIKIAEIKADFEVDPVEEIDLEWVKELTKNSSGKIENTLPNLELILINDPKLTGLFGLDEFNRGSLILRRDAPWGTKKDTHWESRFDSELHSFVAKAPYNIASKKHLIDAINTIAGVNKFHPVRDYLNSLDWDGVKRLDTLFIDFLGIEDSNYTREVTSKSLIAAVQRVFRPGVKFDQMVILVGPQGVGKSTILSKLGGKWFSDSLPSMQGKDAFEHLQGNWIIEVAELSALQRTSTAGKVKSFLSACEDRFRPAYGRTTEVYPRQCVFFGTTNEEEFLYDSTGDRRFWPLRCRPEFITKNIFSKDLDVEQVWAEATDRRKESLLLSKNSAFEAIRHQEDHYSSSVYTDLIEAFLEKEVPAGWDKTNLADRKAYWFKVNNDEPVECETEERTRVSAREVWVEALNRDVSHASKSDIKEINDVIKRTKKWTEEVQRTKAYGVQRGFKKSVTF